MRFTFILLCSLFVFISAPAHAGWFDFLFPSPAQQGPNPAETLRAPFADGDAVIEELDASGESKQITPLHLRHRPNTTITLWVQQTLPMFLSYKTATYNDEYVTKIQHFSKTGADEYVQFLNKYNFLTTLKSGRYDISGFLQDYPVVLNEGPVDGRYRWLYQTNVMVTYIKSGTSDYKQIGEDEAISKEYTLTIQFGRSDTSFNPHGLLVDNWSVKEKK